MSFATMLLMHHSSNQRTILLTGSIISAMLISYSCDQSSDDDLSQIVGYGSGGDTGSGEEPPGTPCPGDRNPYPQIDLCEHADPRPPQPPSDPKPPEPWPPFDPGPRPNPRPPFGPNPVPGDVPGEEPPTTYFLGCVNNSGDSVSHQDCEEQIQECETNEGSVSFFEHCRFDETVEACKVDRDEFDRPKGSSCGYLHDGQCGTETVTQDTVESCSSCKTEYWHWDPFSKCWVPETEVHCSDHGKNRKQWEIPCSPGEIALEGKPGGYWNPGEECATSAPDDGRMMCGGGKCTFTMTHDHTNGCAPVIFGGGTVDNDVDCAPIPTTGDDGEEEHGIQCQLCCHVMYPGGQGWGYVESEEECQAQGPGAELDDEICCADLNYCT